MMPDWIHKVIVFFTNPVFAGMAVLVVSALSLARKRTRCGYALFFGSFLWLYLWSLPLVTWFVGLPLERGYPPQRAEDMPSAEVICVLGGGMGISTNVECYANMSGPADRVWHGARLYKAGKAPAVALTGPRVRKSSAPLLVDFGVPESAIVFFEDGDNTEDEARMIAAAGYKKVLLVTSAWHMRRAKWLFERKKLEVVPAACDYAAYPFLAPLERPFIFLFVPSADSIAMNCTLFKEHFAYWCYCLSEWMGMHG